MIPADSSGFWRLAEGPPNIAIPAELRHSGIDTGMFCGMQLNGIQLESSFQNGILFIIELTF